PRAPGQLGEPPPAAGRWAPWRGDLPTQVAAAYGRGRKPGHDWRGTIGSGTWVVRADGAGVAAYTLGAPPYARRVPVSAWRFEGQAAPRRTLRAVGYLGDPLEPWPPFSPGWFATLPDERTQAEIVPRMLGELPPYHYCDELTTTGLYRFFVYETGAGQRAIGSLRFWGTLGDPSTLGDVAGDKASFDSQIAQGDSALSTGAYGQAVTFYQAAGNLGATTLGPEIDAQTNGASQAITQQAWGLNTNLATIVNDATAGQSDAQNAQGVARQMQALYEQALAMAPPTPNAPAPTPSSGTPSNPTPQLNQATTAAKNVISYFATHACGKQAIASVGAFQTAYNATALGPPITVDQKYGPDTQAALQLVLDFTGGGSGKGGQAPPNCFTAAPAPVPGVNPTPAPGGGGGTPSKPGTTPTVQKAGMSTGGVVGAVLATAAVVGGLVWAGATGNLPSFLQKPT
ncbi:MAG: hypothetical protein ACRDNM_00180, partial [Gaiellaceae bacterium]